MRLLGNGLLPMIVGGGAAWSSVSLPVGFTPTVPFTVQNSSTEYRVDPAFNLQTYADISVTKTYYVDSAAGSDSNSGLSSGAAFKTLSKVETQGDCDLCYIASGSYFYKNQRPTQFTRSMKIIALGSGATITSDISNQLTGWSADGNHYQREPMPDFVAEVVDMSNLDSFGHPIRLTAVASESLVDSTPNSVYVNYSTGIYVRTFDSRAPDSNLRFMDSVAMNFTQDNKKFYFENCEFMRGLQIRNLSATANIKAYFKNCTMRSVTIAGVTECIFQDCTLYGGVGDGINYDVRNGVICNGYEVDCEAYNLGTDSSSQASTTHNLCNVVRVNGRYHHTYGQCVADTGGGQTWMLGTEIYNSSPGGVGFYCDNTSWLDGVNIHDCATYGIQIANSTRSVFYRNVTNTSGLLQNGATYEEY